MWRRPVEVSYNDGDGQSDAENSTDGAEWGHQLPGRGPGWDVPVARAGHGDDGPVQGLGQRVEHRVRLVLLQGVAQPSEYQHAHADRHTEEQQLPVAVPQGRPQGLETSDMSRQLEYPQDPQNSEYLRGLGDIFQWVLWGQLVEDKRNEEWEDSKEVNNIEEWENKLKLKRKEISLVWHLAAA